MPAEPPFPPAPGLLLGVESWEQEAARTTDNSKAPHFKKRTRSVDMP
jgi:hypothetical protein